ncbi:hypothetical protein CCACVL1_01381, partial [Corchorus capsularis]
ATPGFELGNKGFAVPRLTARPCRQKTYKQKTESTPPRSFFIIVLSVLNSFFS